MPSPDSDELTKPESLTHADLLRLYEVTVQEYRFQVLFNWDRSKQLLVFIAAVLAIAGAAYKLDSNGHTQGPTSTIIGIAFLVVMLASVLGIAGVRRGHTYYRNIRDTKIRYERLLELPDHKLALETTIGMKDAHHPDKAELKRTKQAWQWAGKLTTHLQFLFWVLALSAAAGAITVFMR